LDLIGKFLELFDCKVLDATSNLMQWFEIFLLQKDKAFWAMEVTNLWDKVDGDPNSAKRI
jgi:hypothetical protein